MTTTRPDTNSGEPVVWCDRVTRTYREDGRPSWLPRLGRGQGRPPVTALSDVSIRVGPGEVVGVAGPSGSGKTTLLHLMAGLEQPTAGRVYYRGTDLSTFSHGERTAHRLEHVGIVFQRFHLLDTLTARTNVALPLVELGVGRRARRERATERLEQVGLGHRVDHRPPELSGGEQQRVAIARALVTDPDLLLADEPTGELDTTTGDAILQLCRDAATDDRAVVIASHDEQALGVTDRVIRLRDGARTDSQPNTA